MGLQNHTLIVFTLFLPEFTKAMSSRQQLDAQLNENKVVQSELALLPADRRVYKAIGPVLIRTEIVEAKQNVDKRIDYISKELKRFDDLLTTLEKKQDAHRETLHKLQQQFQQSKVKAGLMA